MRMISLDVLDSRGERLGCVIDIILDIGSGRVLALSLLVNAGASDEPQVVMIPWHAVRFDRERACLCLVEGDAVLRTADGATRVH